MAEENQQKIEAAPSATPVVDQGVEAKDRGLFDLLGKKEEEKPQEEVIASEFGEKVKVSETEHKEEEEKEKKPGGLLEKLHRTGSSSSSSSDEEEKEGEEKKKKKKKKEKQQQHEEDVTVPVEKVEEPAQPEDKGFLEKIKDKLPGHNKETEDVPPPPPPSSEPAATLTIEPAATSTTEPPHEGDTKEKKGFLEKIKEKLPGYHAKTDEEKEKEKETASH